MQPFPPSLVGNHGDLADDDREQHADRRERLIRQGCDDDGNAGMARRRREREHGPIVLVGPAEHVSDGKAQERYQYERHERDVSSANDIADLRPSNDYCSDQFGIGALLGAFNAHHPGVHVETQTMSVPAQLAALVDGQLDVAFARPPVTDHSLASELVISEPLVAALPPNHSFASRGRLPLSALAGEIFVLPPRDIVPVFHSVVFKACRAAGFVPRAIHEADHLHVVLGLVAAGAGVALVPASARKIHHGKLTYHSLHPSPDKVETALAWRRDDKSPAVAAFLSTVHRVRVT